MRHPMVLSDYDYSSNVPPTPICFSLRSGAW